MAVVKNVPVEMYQDEEEFAALLAEFRKLKPKKILEVGSMFGGTLWHWINNAPKGASVLAVDLVVPESDGRYLEQKIGHDEQWPGWAKDAKVNLLVMDEDSKSPRVREAILDFLGNDIDFVFIDGDHSYNAVRADFDNFAPFVKDGGIVALHDINNRGTGVPEFWQAVKGSHYGAGCTEITNSPHGGIGMVKIARA